MFKLFKLFFASLIVVILTTLFATPTFALPADVSKTKLATGFNQSTAIAVAPDNRVFVLEKGGTIKIFKNGQILSTPLLSLNVNSDGERGLLGIALDPTFSQNGFIYLYYTNASPLETHVSRFTVSGDTANPASEVVLFKTTAPLNTVHQSGTLRIGPDNKLWISIGNNGDNSNPQNLSTPFGKILRINLDGSIPSDNPFVGNTNANKAVYAYGFRNPFRFNFLPNGKPIVGDVGETSFEEVNIIQKGGNYGWPNAEGPCSNCSSINPLFSYPHAQPGASYSVTGGVFYTGSQMSSYTNSYFYGDYGQGFLRRIAVDSNYNFVSDNSFDDAAGTIVDMAQDTQGNIFTINIFPGTLYEYSKVTGTQSPNPQIAATPTAGMAPLQVSFSSQGSSDPQNLPLSYSWNFGDNTTSNAQNPTHTYASNGSYLAQLTVSNGQKSATISTIITVGRTNPTAVILTPSNNAHYNAGDTINFSGKGTDSQDGNLSNDKLSWTIIFHHLTHIHPFAGPIQGDHSSFVIPTTGEVSTLTWYEIQLRVTNSAGLVDTKSITIMPNTVSIAIASNVNGATVTVDGIPQTTPYTLPSVVGFTHTLDTQTPQVINGASFNFINWSNSNQKAQTFTAPSQNTTITANFAHAGSGKGFIRLRVRGFNEQGNPTGQFLNGVNVKLTDPQGSTVFAATTSQTLDNQEGWALFDNVDAGTYGIATYKQGYQGFWRQTDCNGNGTTQNATINNNNTELNTAAFQPGVSVIPNQVTWCQDTGLIAQTKGVLLMKVMLVERFINNHDIYSSTAGINGATVKLTDQTGQNVIAQTTSAAVNGDDGWAVFPNIPQGTYGLLAYKTGMIGFAKQLDCSNNYGINSTIANANTEGQTAAFNNAVSITGGQNTFCTNLGLKGYGAIGLRIREADINGNPTRFLNDVTVKLTDIQGTTVYQTVTSQTNNNEAGWAIFNPVEAGTYSILAFKQGYQGIWRQTDCNGTGTTQDATITNNTTSGLVGGIQSNFHVNPSQTIWCKDIGLKNNVQADSGSLFLRMRSFDQNNQQTGFLNNATVKLLAQNGSVIQTQQSQAVSGQDGWAVFTNIPIGTYSLVGYKAGLTGLWRQTDCNGNGTTQNTTVQNSTTDNIVASTQPQVTITKNQITWCQDMGLKTSGPSAAQQTNTTSAPSPTSNPTSSVTPTPLPTQKLTPPPTSTPQTTPLPTEHTSGESPKS